MSQNNQRKHYHIHAPYQHPQQQQQHHHHLTTSQQQHQHHQQQQLHHHQQWYTHGSLAPQQQLHHQQQQQQHYQQGLHLRDSRHIQHPQHHHHQQQQQQHQNHTIPPHMFASSYVGMTASGGGGGVGGGVGGGLGSVHNTSTMGTSHNMPASSSSSHYSSPLAVSSGSSGGIGSNVHSSNSSNSSISGSSRSRMFDLEMLTAHPQSQEHLTPQLGLSSATHSHSHAMLANAGSSISARTAVGYDAYSHSSLYSSQHGQRHHSAPASHHRVNMTHPSAHALHHHQHQSLHTQQLHQQQQPPSMASHHHQQQLHQQQHFYHHTPQTPLHRPHPHTIPSMLQHIKSEPVEQITITPAIQTEEVIIKCKLKQTQKIKILLNSF